MVVGFTSKYRSTGLKVNLRIRQSNHAKRLTEMFDGNRFSARYNFQKPNDARALNVMNGAALRLMQSLTDVIMAYGDSDEYSFVLRRGCELFERREAKITSTFASTFTALYNQLWPKYFCTTEEEAKENSLQLDMLPTFDARVVTYPTTKSLRDYLSWRQVDCHINNLYNTAFWTLVEKGGMTGTKAEERLRVSLVSFIMTFHNNNKKKKKRGRIG